MTTLFGQAIIKGESKIVEIISANTKTTWVRNCYRDIPFGMPFKRHNKKHKVKVHGDNIIRRNWLKS